MNFVEITPLRGAKKKEGIRVLFQRDEKHPLTITIAIGGITAASNGLRAGDRVSIFYEEENPRVLLLKRALTERSYKLISAGKGSDSVKVTLRWNQPPPERMGTFLAGYEQFQGGVLIKY